MRSLRLGLVVAVAAALALSPAVVGASPASSDAATASPAAVSPAVESPDAVAPDVESPDAEAPPDPESDVLGWENGYWHNESLAVTPDDGLNESELDAVVARSMARVEQIRGIEFDRDVSVSVVSRSEYRETVAEQEEPTAAARLHQNVKMEALFFVGEDTDALGVIQQDQAVSVGGYYDPAADEIVVVSENEETPQLNEITLAQELFHALQGQQFDAFNASWYPGQTREEHNAADGVIEGDGNYVDYLYAQRCDEQWGCLEPDDGSGGGIPPNYGYSLLQFVPYSDGPPFVQQLHEEEGWEAVNELYDDPPASSEQYIHPEKYSDDEPRNLTVEDRSSDEWRVLDVEESIDYASFGEGGVFSMLWYPSYLAGDTEIVPPNVFDDPPPGSIDYTHPASAGWDGDRLVPYVDDSSMETNETGYVWELAWDSPEDATEFRDAYAQLLGFNGGERVGEHTWELDDARSESAGSFADAIHVEVENDTVTVVNAPSVDDLSEIRTDVAVEDNGTATTTDDGAPGEGTTGTGTTDDTGGGGPLPGFGVAVAAVALAIAAAGVRVFGRR